MMHKKGRNASNINEKIAMFGDRMTDSINIYTTLSCTTGSGMSYWS